MVGGPPTQAQLVVHTAASARRVLESLDKVEGQSHAAYRELAERH